MFLEPGEKIQKIPLSTLYLYTQFFILHLNRGGQDIRFHVICWSTFKNAATFLLAGLMKYNSLHQACSEELKVNLLGKPSKSQKLNSKINNIYFNFSIFPVFGQIEYYIVSIFSKLYCIILITKGRPPKKRVNLGTLTLKGGRGQKKSKKNSY